jgi:hypothetical protein
MTKMAKDGTKVVPDLSIAEIVDIFISYYIKELSTEH